VSGAPAVAVVLFDIDGTLISTGGASDRAWHRAFLELHGIEVQVSDYTGRGVPDPAVGLQSFRGALGREPADGEMQALMALRLRYLPEEVETSPGYRVMPGAEALLAKLREDGRMLGLITGNVEDAARIKLAPAGLERFFQFGGYGSDAPERVDVARTALARADAFNGTPVDRAACVAVGDTPRDVEAGHGAGIRVIGVATGSYSVDELRDSGADFALPTLEGGLPLEGSE
jgi:beta-phosphoglucomutase-like phosphatase (HAD superfamily)